LLIFIACLVDYIIGDPIGWLHPVQVIGWVIDLGKKMTIDRFNHPRFSPIQMKCWGIVLGALVMAGTPIVGLLFCLLFAQIHPSLGQLCQIILLSSCLAGKSLRQAAEDVLQNLEDLTLARKRLSCYVGRDTDDLSEKEILRAVLETVTENGVDGVTAPLFYSILGELLCSPWGGVIGALLYKASSTLDSMIGYKESPFTDLGWFSAKTEDVLTWLPCRLTVFTLGLLSGRPFYVWRICQRDAIYDPSPNSGWSECVYAAILHVRLGGKNRYRGIVKIKPFLGEDLEPITIDKIRQALNLTRTCCLVWLCCLAVILCLQRLESLCQNFDLITIFF
jgi:adenosylcobinamide-phosphate synthase